MGRSASGVVKPLQEHAALLDGAVGARLRIRRIAEIGHAAGARGSELLTRTHGGAHDPQVTSW